VAGFGIPIVLGAGGLVWWLSGSAERAKEAARKKIAEGAARTLRAKTDKWNTHRNAQDRLLGAPPLSFQDNAQDTGARYDPGRHVLAVVQPRKAYSTPPVRAWGDGSRNWDPKKHPDLDAPLLDNLNSEAVLAQLSGARWYPYNGQWQRVAHVRGFAAGQVACVDVIDTLAFRSRQFSRRKGSLGLVSMDPRIAFLITTQGRVAYHMDRGYQLRDVGWAAACGPRRASQRTRYTWLNWAASGISSPLGGPNFADQPFAMAAELMLWAFFRRPVWRVPGMACESAAAAISRTSGIGALGYARTV